MLGLLAVTSVPTVIGVAESVHQQRRQNQQAAEEDRLQKFRLVVECPTDADVRAQLAGNCVVLDNNRVYIDTSDPSTRDRQRHALSGFYLSYPWPDDHPAPPTRGLVSTISSDPPMLNWIYVDKTTAQLKYGNRTQSMQHIVGSWDWTDDRRLLTLQERKKFVVVEEHEGWALYLDCNDDLLHGIVADKRVVPVFLERILENKENKSEA